MELEAADLARKAAEQVARDSYGRLVAYLAARTRDVAGAEDALAEAFATALRVWPVNGVPNNPDAWLLTAARRRQTDALRRRQTQLGGAEHLKLMADEIDAAAQTPDAMPDRRLGLMFACAHPAIEKPMRSPLILQTVLGLSAQEIAPLFLISPATMGQRLVRAKARIKLAGIPFRVPEAEELPERLDAVLEAIYAAYSSDWIEGDAQGNGLADEAIWLGRLIVATLPDEPEPKGMLSLMLHVEARRPARRDSTGAYVPLDLQDVDLWDHWSINAAEALLSEANRAGPTGRYQIEAAIQSVHAARRVSGQTRWLAVAALYDKLHELTGSPVVLLNHAVAIARLDGAEAGLASLLPLAHDPRMANYQPYWAVRGALLQEAGRTADAYEALTLAMGLTSDPAVRDFLMSKRNSAPRTA